MTATAFGYGADTAPLVTIVTDQTTTQDFTLAALPRFTVSGHVTAAEDGSPIEGAFVLAVGTPVPAAKTDASGAYSLELPIGTFTLRGSSGGCTETAFVDIESLGPDLTQDFSLARKLDDFGHGCREIPFDWVDAGTQSALFGDEFAGRLRLPFDFSFYGETYSAVYLSDNGYLNFLAADQFNPFPVGIPSKGAPNAAIYALWQDLVLDTSSGIDYDTIGTAPDRTFVIEYAGMRAGGTSRVSFEIKLHEDGRIDLLYGPNPPNPGDGRNALSGIENATGTDALQISLFDGVIEPNSAVRIEPVASGLVHGTVVDKNDGLPIAGATVTASPGDRTTHTAEDGSYTLRLRPGHYTLFANSENYVEGSADLTVTDGGDEVRDFSLAAPIAAPDPTDDRRGGRLRQDDQRGRPPRRTPARPCSTGAPASATSGSSCPTCRRSSRRRSPTGPAGTGRRSTAACRRPRSRRTCCRPARSARSSPTRPATAPGRSTRPPSAAGPTARASWRCRSTSRPTRRSTRPSARSTSTPTRIRRPASRRPAWPACRPRTSARSTSSACSPSTTPIRSSSSSTSRRSRSPAPGRRRSTARRSRSRRRSMRSARDDGFMDVDLVLGDPNRPMDYVPDVGHGTIQPFTDLPWLSESPEAGETPAGGSTDVTLALGTPDLTPGTYHGLVVFVTNAPKQQQVPVEVNFTVNLPDAFGAIEGTVSDAHTGAPIAGASVVVHATWQGAPLDSPRRPTTAAPTGSSARPGPGRPTSRPPATSRSSPT